MHRWGIPPAHEGALNGVTLCIATPNAALQAPPIAGAEHRLSAVTVPVSKRGRLLARRLSDKAVTWILQTRAQATGVVAFSPHDLRRTFISSLLDASVDLATVADLAGHANISTTAKYDRRGEEAKRKAAARLIVPFVPTAKAS